MIQNRIGAAVTVITILLWAAFTYYQLQWNPFVWEEAIRGEFIMSLAVCNFLGAFITALLSMD